MSLFSFKIRVKFQFFIGWHGLENRWIICGSHDAVNIFKLAEKNLYLNAENRDWKSK